MSHAACSKPADSDPHYTLDCEEPEKPRSRFSSSKDQAALALEPSLVVEVAFDQLEGSRFRHAVQLVRFRPDRQADSCLLEQVERAPSYDLSQVLTD